MICKYFSHSVVKSLFTMSMVSFDAQKLLILIKCNLPIFSFVACVFAVIAKKYCQIQCHEAFFLCFLLSFIDLALMFRSLILFFFFSSHKSLHLLSHSLFFLFFTFLLKYSWFTMYHFLLYIKVTHSNICMYVCVCIYIYPFLFMYYFPPWSILRLDMVPCSMH